MKILIVPNDPLSAYSDLDRWMDRPHGYEERGHEVLIFRTGEWDLRKLDEYLKAIKPDVVRTLEGGRFVISAIVADACIRTGTKFVPSLHGIDVECNIARKYSKDQAEYFTNCRKYVLAAADAIIGTQLSYLRYVAEFGFINKAVFIPNYIDLELFTEKCPAENRIIHVGRLDPHDKDILSVCEAATIVSEAMPEIKPLFIGSGPMLSEVQKYGFENISGVPNTEIPKYISSSKMTLFADPPEYTGFGIPVMESQACCRPVVFCRSGPREFVDKYEPDNDVEYFMNPKYRVRDAEEMAQVILHLLGDEQEWRREGINCRNRVERNFSRKDILDAEVALYERVRKGT